MTMNTFTCDQCGKEYYSEDNPLYHRPDVVKRFDHADVCAFCIEKHERQIVYDTIARLDRYEWAERLNNHARRIAALARDLRARTAPLQESERHYIEELHSTLCSGQMYINEVRARMANVT